MRTTRSSRCLEVGDIRRGYVYARDKDFDMWAIDDVSGMKQEQEKANQKR
jgi:hypothetical protein